MSPKILLLTKSKTMKMFHKLMIFCVLIGISAATYGQVRNVSGVVTSDKDGLPVAEVSVRVKGSIEAVKTNADGRYAINVPESSSLTIIFIHPDHDEKEVVLGGRNQLDVVMVNSVRYNQYGRKVNRNLLTTEEREGILIMESADQDYKMWFDLRVQTDGAIFFGDVMNPIANGLEMRRVRLAFKAELPGPWEAEVDMDFADALADLKDAYLLYNASPRLDIKVGYYKERFSMEQNTSSRFLTFMERPAALRTIAPSRHIGIQFHYYRPYVIAVGGLHFQDAGDFEVVENRKTNYAAGNNEGYSLTGKITALPFYNDVEKGLHLAVAGSYRTPKTHDRIDMVRFDSRSNININRIKYLDTDRISNVDNYTLANFEFAGFYRNIKFASEYIMAQVNRYESKVDGEKIGSLPSENLSGFYVMSSIMLFGGQHVYNNYQGEFTQPLKGRPWGDVEFGLRYDFTDFNSREGGVMAGSGEGFTLALSYYTPSNVKLIMNYGYLNFDRYANSRGARFVGTDASGNLTRDPALVTEPSGEGGERFHWLGFRVQVSF
jgi:phosphate-selective porin OprO and OprP